MNHLYYSDNLDVLRRYIKDESVDLVYLDPPFKSNQDYNVLFAEKDGTGAAAQFKAFEDTWEWNTLSAAMYEEIVERAGRRFRPRSSSPFHVPPYPRRNPAVDILLICTQRN